ncbi:MAG: TonB-dependent receptor plug domain-containing protein [Bacteroidales bacterium]|nr:TonB-dependent receptor plug domain-containing protein [Bacteroidales bacterium]
MRKIIVFMACIATVCSCGTFSNVSDSGEEMVDLGYGRVRKSHNTSAASSVDIEKMDAKYTNIFDYLRGTVPGLYVGPLQGAGSQPEMYIRGVNSINGDITPLILVDGAEMSSIALLDPSIVSRVTVLKGPEAAIYGARGANGVILISTKTAGGK